MTRATPHATPIAIQQSQRYRTAEVARILVCHRAASGPWSMRDGAGRDGAAMPGCSPSKISSCCAPRTACCAPASRRAGSAMRSPS